MKKLQNNFTTPEQSKRLLELGVPADSADCMNFGNADIFQIPFQRPFSEHLEFHVREDMRKMYTPCWSVGRLIEIFLTCAEPDNIYDVSDIYFTAVQANNLMEKIIYEFEHSICIYSKLEE